MGDGVGTELYVGTGRVVLVVLYWVIEMVVGGDILLHNDVSECVPECVTLVEKLK